MEEFYGDTMTRQQVKMAVRIALASARGKSQDEIAEAITSAIEVVAGDTDETPEQSTFGLIPMPATLAAEASGPSVVATGRLITEPHTSITDASITFENRGSVVAAPPSAPIAMPSRAPAKAKSSPEDLTALVLTAEKMMPGTVQLPVKHPDTGVEVLIPLVRSVHANGPTGSVRVVYRSPLFSDETEVSETVYLDDMIDWPVIQSVIRNKAAAVFQPRPRRLEPQVRRRSGELSFDPSDPHEDI